MKPINKKVVTILLILIVTQKIGYSQEYIFASQGGGTDKDFGTEVTTDQNGDTYMAGSFYSYECYLETDTLKIKGANDIIIVKYDARGNEVWLKQLGWNNGYDIEDSEQVGSLVFDTNHNRVLVSGTFYMHLNLPDTTLNSWGMAFFVLSMDAEGNVLWGRTATSLDQYWDSDPQPFGITYDEDGNVYVSGSNSDTLNFDGIKVPKGGFLAKYDIDGNIIWAKNKFRYWSPFQSPKDPYTEGPPYGLAYFKNHLIVAGNLYNDTLIIDTISMFFNPGDLQTYVCSFSTDGEVEWLKVAGGPKSGWGEDVVCDYNGNIYIKGIFRSQGYFGEDTLINSVSYNDGFLSKLNSNGEFLWTIPLISSASVWPNCIEIDNKGDVYIAGDFSGGLQFGDKVEQSASDEDMFIASCTKEGVTRSLQKNSQGSILGLSSDLLNRIAMVGYFRGSLELTPYTLVSRGYTDIFITKSAPITGVENTEEFASNRLLVYANPNTGECTITIPEEIRNEKELLLQVFDQNGKLIMQSALDSSSGTAPIDIRSHARGIYQAVLTSGSRQYSGKIVFTK